MVARGVRSYCRDCEFGREREREREGAWSISLGGSSPSSSSSRYSFSSHTRSALQWISFHFKFSILTYYNFDICCIAVNVPCRTRIWLSKSIWFLKTNKFGDVTWILYSSYSYRLLSYYWPLDHVFLLSSLSILQFQIVSFYFYCAQNVIKEKYLTAFVL